MACPGANQSLHTSLFVFFGTNLLLRGTRREIKQNLPRNPQAMALVQRPTLAALLSPTPLLPLDLVHGLAYQSIYFCGTNLQLRGTKTCN